MVRMTGLEPAHLSVVASKATSATITTHPHLYTFGARGRTRTGTPIKREILSLLCLPVSPPGH